MFVVDEPGPDVLYLRIAASNVYMQKKKRGLLGYTPVGLVAGTASRALSDFVDNIVLQEMTFELELLDSQTDTVLAALVDKTPAGKKKKPAESWEDARAMIQYWADRLACRIGNIRKAPGEAAQCEADLIFE